MSMNITELEAESAELLPGREALGRLKFNFTKTVNVTKHVATVNAHNHSTAVNIGSNGADAESEAAQTIVISQ
ncbi:hypothetical protein [Streptacidiphilus fuscans]|uniref:Uncharacterized protein n=1 Tax=Streptacidiphilus fuscans TaxID=2789292 RepID=A0A931BB15_9ACTN|nr:hypothetical protein [Streptacidiphilus fuscans]MBF9071621.1 hypothetical protein [Streptacidiphilus fuscans]MBF9072892.1 hypothetical protein [Streptacidiphilus fuscans]